jgi:hypothetical protein
MQSLGSKISRALNRRSENVIVEAIIIPELELRNVKWHVFGADLVERANDAALENAPKALNRLGVDRADDILMLGVVNGRMGVGLRDPCNQPIDPCNDKKKKGRDNSRPFVCLSSCPAKARHPVIRDVSD